MFEKNQGGLSVKFKSKESVEVANSIQISNNYTLDRIFDINTKQEDIYNEVARPVTEDILRGFNGTIFTYGQSGSGKTFTMYGTDLYDPDLKGVIPRTIDHIFQAINAPENKEIKFEIKFSMLEIYKEGLYDLLNPETKTADLKIKDHPKKGIYVTNLTEKYISSQEEILEFVENAEDYRVVSATGLNKNSSRSHLLFQMQIRQELPDGVEKKGILNLIDLAGSEKVSKTHAQGDTLEEAKKINLSLSTLGNVISALSSGNSDFVPYRDSKLTRILQDSLGGNYKTTLVVTCSPHIYNCEETIGTLKFAQRAKKVKNKVKCNIKRSVEQLESLIELLTKQLELANSEIIRLKGTPVTIASINDNNLLNQNINYQNLLNEFANRKPLENNKVCVDSEALQLKDDEIENLKNEIENLTKENSILDKELKTIIRHNNFDKVLKELDEMVKSNIEQVNKLPTEMEKLIIESLRNENERLRERFKKKESKYANILKDLKDNIKCDKGKIEDHNSKLKENYNSIKLNFKEFFNTLDKHLNCKEKPNAHEQYVCATYKNLFLESKLYSSQIIEEFVYKNKNVEDVKSQESKLKIVTESSDDSDNDNEFEDRLLEFTMGTISNFDNKNINSIPTSDQVLKKDYLELKESFMKSSLLNFYLEKIIFDLINKFSSDLEKFELESRIKINMEDKCKNFNKIMMTYLSVLDEIKIMSKQSQVHNLASNIISQNQVQVHFHEEKRNSLLSEVKILKQEQEILKSSFVEVQPIKRTSIRNIIKPINKSTKFLGVVHEHVKMNPCVLNESDNEESSSLSEENIATTQDKRKGSQDPINLIRNFNEGKLKTSSRSNVVFVNNDTSYSSEKDLIKTKELSRRATFGMSKFLTNIYATKDSILSIHTKNSNQHGSVHAVDSDAMVSELKQLRKEYILYKNTIENLTNEDLSLKTIKSEYFKIITRFQDNQKSLFKNEVDNFRNILYIYKGFLSEKPLKSINEIQDYKK